MQLSAAIKSEARIFSFVVREQDEGTVNELKLPADSRVIFLYRGDKFILADEDSKLQKDDEVVIACRNKVLPDLEARWSPAATEQ